MKKKLLKDKILIKSLFRPEAGTASLPAWRSQAGLRRITLIAPSERHISRKK